MCNITTSLSDSIYASRLYQQEEGTAAGMIPFSFLFQPTKASNFSHHQDILSEGYFQQDVRIFYSHVSGPQSQSLIYLSSRPWGFCFQT